MKERRTARRYKLVLQIEITPEADRKGFEPILGRTRDISTHGFFLRMGQKLSVGTKIGFSIMPPAGLAQAEHAFITGRARVTRIEEVSENNGDHTITVKMSGFKEWTREITVQAGSELQLSATLEK